MCQPGAEILANMPLSAFDNNLDLINHTINRWDNSPGHKAQMVSPEGERAFFAVIVYEGQISSKNKKKTTRVIFVGQFLKSEEYYVERGWDETGGKFMEAFFGKGATSVAEMDTSSPEFSKSVVGSLQNKFGHLYDSNAEFYKMIAREIEKGLKDDANMKIEDLIGNIFTDINKKEQDVL